MEVFHLRYFAAVAENLSFSRAARELHMAVSPLSRRVRDLERELDVRLFERDSHNVALTSAGSALLPLAREALARFDEIPRRLRQELGTQPRVMHVGIAPALNEQLRNRLKEFEGAQRSEETQRSEQTQPSEQTQRFEVRRWPGGSLDLAGQVRRQELELALVHLPVHVADVQVREVMREPVGAVLPAAEFAGRSSVSLAELADHVFVRPGSGMNPTYFEQLEVRMAAAGVHRWTTLNSLDYSGTAEFVASGGAFAITILGGGESPSGPRRDDVVVRDDVVALPFADFEPVLATGLIYRTDRAAPGGDLHELLTAAIAALG